MKSRLPFNLHVHKLQQSYSECDFHIVRTTATVHYKLCISQTSNIFFWQSATPATVGRFGGRMRKNYV